MIPVQGRRPPLEVTLHAEEDELFLAVSGAPGHPTPKHPPGPATLAQLVSMVAQEVGACALGDWQAFTDRDGSPAGWMTQVQGAGVAQAAAALNAD
ncbi:hypothetical protein L6R53_24590 [Myxococcota bacterium]|nr:hypothetical protein [Myxococcota bacterium]